MLTREFVLADPANRMALGLRQDRRMRRFPFSTLLVAICLLPVGIGSGTSTHGHAIAALEGALANKASEEAQVLADYFSRGQSIDLLTANNPAFQQFYGLPGDRGAKLRSGRPVVDEINQSLAYLERLFPDSIGEACFIDHGGPENARVVRGVRARPADLSPTSQATRSSGPRSPSPKDRSTRHDRTCRLTPASGSSPTRPAFRPRTCPGRPSCTSRSPSRASARWPPR